MGEHWFIMTELAAAAFTAVMLLVVAAVQYFNRRLMVSNRKLISEISDAVNKREPDNPKLYDAVRIAQRTTVENHDRLDELVAWKKQYEGGPLDTAEKVQGFVKSTTSRLDEITRRLDELTSRLDEPEEGKRQ